jgi:PBP1b-binding outer membrane lipoprotein LpoB
MKNICIILTLIFIIVGCSEKINKEKPITKNNQNEIIEQLRI